MSSFIRSIVNGTFNSTQNVKTVTSHQKACAPITELFLRVNTKVDGEKCFHDCQDCTVKYPRNFKIDEEDEIYGQISGWNTHLLVATGKSDWIKNVADEEGSLMQAIEKLADVKPNNGRMMLSASNMPTPSHPADYANPTRVLLLPALLIIENVTPKSVNTLISDFVNKNPTNDSIIGDQIPVDHSLPRLPHLEEPLTSRPCPHNALILLCSQGTRDKRCGQSAPLLKKEFERHLRDYGLVRDLDDENPGGVGIYFISHVGGHKYAANVLIYRKSNAFGLDNEGNEETSISMPQPQPQSVENQNRNAGAAQCIWLARVRPEDCEGIVKFTVLRGKVVKPEKQLRGGFDRERGLYSW